MGTSYKDNEGDFRMNDICVVRKVDELGRVCLPMQLRKDLKIKEGSLVEIVSEEGVIVIKKKNICCECCGAVEDLKDILDLKICPKCLKEFEKATTLINKCR